MTGDKAIKYSTVAAVAVVGLAAAVLSYRHQFELASGHGESAITAKLLPVSINGLLLAGTLAVLDASRRQTGHAWAARVTATLGVAMTMWADIVHGLGFGWTGIIISGWPPVALIAAVEVLARMVRPATAVTEPAAPVLTQIAPTDNRHAAQLAIAASAAAGNPLSQRAVMSRFGLSRAVEREVRQAVLASSNGHAPQRTTSEEHEEDHRHHRGWPRGRDHLSGLCGCSASGTGCHVSAGHVPGLGDPGSGGITAAVTRP